MRGYFPCLITMVWVWIVIMKSKSKPECGASDLFSFCLQLFLCISQKRFRNGNISTELNVKKKSRSVFPSRLSTELLRIHTVRHFKEYFPEFIQNGCLGGPCEYELIVNQIRSAAHLKYKNRNTKTFLFFRISSNDCVCWYFTVLIRVNSQ